MSGKLNTFVHVHRGGETKAFGPDDTVPDWAAKLITNPDVWATPPAETVEDSQKSTGGDPGTSAGAGQGPGTDGDQNGAQSPSDVPIPPKGGKGSSASAWAAYALAKGFEVDADAKASEIIDALADAGIPTE